MNDYKPKASDVILVYILLPLALVLAILGDEEAQHVLLRNYEVKQALLCPFKILMSKIQTLVNYLGSQI